MAADPARVTLNHDQKNLTLRNPVMSHERTVVMPRLETLKKMERKP